MPKTSAKKKTSKPKKKRTSMPKDTLTGGSRDVNPQYLSGRVTQSAADTSTTQSFNLPVTRIPQSNRVTIVEILKIFVNSSNWPANAAAAWTLKNINIVFSSISFATTAANFNEPNVFAFFDRNWAGCFTDAYTAVDQYDDLMIRDLTDGAGHGILLATDQIYVQVNSVGTGLSVNCDFKILYRFKTVSITEYVGIVQSQQ